MHVPASARVGSSSAHAGRLDSIDGLRAIAMMMVVAQHCGLLPFGWMGVWLFFVISGYVITLGFDEGPVERGRRMPVFLNFAHRRFVRIVPVYLLYIACNLPILLTLGKSSGLWDLPYLLTFTYNWRMIFDLWPAEGGWSLFSHLWTLSVEQQFYLIFPLLMIVVAPAMRTRWCVALVLLTPLLRFAASLVATRMGVAQPSQLAFGIYASSFLHLDAFLIGSLLARYRHDDEVRRLVARYLLPATIVTLGVYTAVYLAINVQHGALGVEALRNIFSGNLAGQYREVFVYIAVDAIAATVLWFAVEAAPLRGWLGTPAISWVGRVSYGGYLFHMLMLWVLASAWQAPKSLPVPERVVFFVAASSLTIIVASMSFVWFELPLARWLRHSTNARAPEPAVVGSI